MSRGLEMTGSGAGPILNHIQAPERANLITEMKQSEAARLLAKEEPPKAAETLLNIKDEKAAVKLFNTMEAEAAARIIPEIGAIQPVAHALDAAHASHAAKVLEILAETRPRLAASTLDAMTPEQRIAAIKKMENQTASNLLGLVKQQTLTEIADQLKPARTAELLDGVPSPAKVAETLQQMQHTDVAIETFKKLDDTRQVEVLSEVGSRSAALAMNEVPSRQAAGLLTELVVTKPEQATRIVEAMKPDARVRAVKKMERSAASHLLEHTKSRIAGEILDHLKTSKAIAIVTDIKSPAKADSIVAHMKIDMALQVAEKLTQIRNEELAQTAQAKATAHVLETRPPEDARKEVSHLDTEKLAQALKHIESPQQAAETLLNLSDRKAAVEVLSSMESTEAVRVIEVAGPKATALAFEQMKSQRVAQHLEELASRNPELADRTLGAMAHDARVETMNALPLEVASNMWERMSPTIAVNVAKSMPIERVARMVDLMEPEKATQMITRLDTQTQARLVLSLDKLAEGTSGRFAQIKEKIKVGAGVAATTPIVTTIGLIPTIILDGPTNFFGLLAGGAVATAVAGNYYYRVRDKITVPTKTPVIGGKSLSELPNTSQIVNMSLWAIVATATELIKQFL